MSAAISYCTHSPSCLFLSPCTSTTVRAWYVTRKEGAEGFLKVQYTAIAKIAVFLLAFIVMSYVLRPTGSSELQNTGVRRIGNTTLGLISGACFLVGALCSAAAGYISM